MWLSSPEIVNFCHNECLSIHQRVKWNKEISTNSVELRKRSRQAGPLVLKAPCCVLWPALVFRSSKEQSFPDLPGTELVTSCIQRELVHFDGPSFLLVLRKPMTTLWTLNFWCTLASDWAIFSVWSGKMRFLYIYFTCTNRLNPMKIHSWTSKYFTQLLLFNRNLEAWTEICPLPCISF